MKDEMKTYLSPEDILYYTSLGINLDSDLLDPKVDSVFKAIFTSDTKESRKALMHFLSNVLKREVTTVVIKNNEPATTGLLEKQASFDIHVTFDDDDEADIEMQMQIKDNLINRSEYNTAKLYSSQGIKGKMYGKLKMVYTIMVLNCTLFKDREDFFDEYMYRNAQGRILSGNTQIIFIELTKLDKILKKPVSEMTATEKWAVFLKYANHKDKQNLIQRITNSEEGIKMCAQVLETISRDRDEYIAHYQRLKAEADKESQLLYAHSEGVKEGIEEGIKKGIEKGIEKGIKKGIEKGIKKGIEKGIQEGKKEGQKEEKIQIAKNLFLIGLALEQIEQATGLSSKELQNLCKQ